jgi:hypothetical protein
VTAGVDHDVAELAIGHQCQGLELWDLRRDAFVKVSDHVATLIGQPDAAKIIALARSS